MTLRTRMWGVPLTLFIVALWPAVSHAQSHHGCEGIWLASPDVRSQEWTAGAVRWLQDRGELSGWPLPQGRVPAGVVACLLDRVDHGDERVSGRWTQRLHAEVGEVVSSGRGRTPVPSARFGAALVGSRGGAAPGTGLVGPEATGAEIREGVRGGVAHGWVAGRTGRVYGFVEGELVQMGGARVRAADLGAQLGSFGAAVGRGRVAYGGGGLIFSGESSLNRLEVATVQPLELPGFLRMLGPIAGHTFIAALPEGRHTQATWLWGGSATVQPVPRLELSLHRGMMIGGAREARSAPMTAANVMHAFLGRHNNFRGEYVGDLRNQILSADVRYRLPLHPAWPVTAYLEWGTEDSAGGLRDVPGIVAGLRTSPLLGATALTFGLEQTYLGKGQRHGNPPWYRHGVFSGGWAADEIPLGHPLGGHGREWAGYIWVDAPAGVQMDLRAMTRTRGELNLFVPGWEGRSTALDAITTWSPLFGFELVTSTHWEGGDGWRRWEVRAGVEGSLP